MLHDEDFIKIRPSIYFATLAAVLVFGMLVGRVFLPGREGSLQIEMLAGARVEVAPYKRDAGDFVRSALNADAEPPPTNEHKPTKTFPTGMAKGLERSTLQVPCSG